MNTHDDTERAWGVFFHAFPNSPHRVFDEEGYARLWAETEPDSYFVQPVTKAYFHGPTLTVYVWQPIPEEDQ